MVVDDDHRGAARLIVPLTADASSSTSVPDPGAERIDRASRRGAPSGRRSTRARHDGRRSTRLRVEALAAVADEDAARRVVRHLGVDGDRPAVGGELGRVRERLAGGGDERPGAWSSAQVADRDHVDRHAVRVLHLRRRGLASAAARLSPLRRRARRTAMSAARAPGGGRAPPPHAGSPARFCIRVSVCSTESWRCAASSARSWERIRSARSAARLRPRRHRNGARIRASAGGRRDHREHDVAGVAEDVVGGEEEEHGADDERDPEATAIEVAISRPSAVR